MTGGMFGALRNGRFARFYAAQAASQLGDAISWIALALLAVQLEGSARAPIVVSIALTLRVIAFVVLGPIAGVVADRLDRRLLLTGCHVGRMVSVGLMFAVTEAWHVYMLILLTNAFTAFFTPANQATVQLVAGRDNLRGAFALSAATTEVFGIVGPGLAGLIALGTGARALFLVVAATFGIAALLVFTLGPVRPTVHPDATQSTRWADVQDGTLRLWRDGHIRFALLMELVAAISGALVLTVTVARVQHGLSLSDAHFGWVMAAYGLGATLASFAVAHLGAVPLVRWISAGAVLTTMAVLPGDVSPYGPLLALWAFAGVGQNWVNLPAETLIAERTDDSAQGRVYGAHFAWSHLWWVLAYPLAGFLAATFPDRTFLIGASIGGTVLIVVVLAHATTLRARSSTP
ncbi:MAG TPA: MFS transporter [Propionibacteriaceae bacterium]|nr:MFS transporter [Propionibacteriaceae bacterium]